MPTFSYEIEEGDRQAIVLALAKLSLTRPGWHPACLRRIADEIFKAGEMYEQFRVHGPDRGAELVMEMDGYAIESVPLRITCFACGSTSYNASNVENRYCGFCKKFHKK